MANSVDQDETPRSAASHLGLNCLLRPVCPNTYGKYGNFKNDFCNKKFKLKANSNVDIFYQVVAISLHT